MHEQTRVYSVSEITSVIKTLLEESLPTVWIEGEISNIKFHSSGHIYFTLKDSGAQIPVVMWRSRTLSLAFQPEDGMKVQVLGNIRVYEKGGRYQLDALMIQPFGQGQLQMEFERLKQKLQAEGLFDAEHKKPLPSYPHTIGVVTSPTGAAIRDIVNVLKRRAPNVQIILRPTLVQGENA
ncbi:MAG TPA: exodeoxyribonuclease VII large subunit, partial [Caldithrix abyssi]|nr:exodeoxyribonuclease VII large subunit [Caldithrix abyssi]